MNIAGNSFTSLNNHSFNRLDNLTELNLRKTQITALPERLFHSLVNLTKLYLKENKITSLPDGIFQNLTNLKDLELSCNQIRDLPNNLFSRLVNLENLDLMWNKLSNIPKGFFDNLISLKRLDLAINRIKFQEDTDPNILIGLNKSTELKLGLNGISILQEGIFKNLVRLERLDLRNNHIMSIPKGFFKDLVNLNYLQLSDNVIKTKDGDVLRIDIKNVKPIPKHIQIDLNDNGNDDQNPIDELITGQNDLEPDTEQNAIQGDEPIEENGGKTLAMHDDEYNQMLLRN